MYKSPLELSSVHREGLLTGFWWFEEPPEEEVREMWEQHRDELMEFWASSTEAWEAAGNKTSIINPPPAGLFSRPSGWWHFDAPEPRREAADGQVETEKCYFRRHPELLTAVERAHLRQHPFSRWELLPASDMGDDQYISDNIWLLEDHERKAFEQHLRARGNDARRDSRRGCQKPSAVRGLDELH
jgi:hypothetical protein